jgi:hypothetical protein
MTEKMAEKKKSFTLGDSYWVVMAGMGVMHKEQCFYQFKLKNGDCLYFDRGKLSGWDNVSGTLMVIIGDKGSKAEQITLGSSIDDVGNVLGTPKRAMRGELWYGESVIYIGLDGTVNGWDIKDKDIETKVFLGKADSVKSQEVTVGLTEEEVLSKKGMPKTLYCYIVWVYDELRITFSYEGIVTTIKKVG